MDILSNSEWTNQEIAYEQKRKEFIDSIDFPNYMDDPFLFMKRQKLTGYLSRIKFFEKILNVKGSIIECGVHKGGSLMLYYHLSSILEPHAFNRKIYGFDTFEGFRSISDNDEKILSSDMFSNTSFDVLNRAIELQDMNRPISHVEKCILVKGDATNTIPQFVEAHPELIVSLLYLDFDLYEPTKVALEHFLPLVPKGGIVAFDELNSKKWMGESKALKELIKMNEIKLEKFSFDPWPSFFVVGD
jgi:hypothetical protein